MTVYSLFDRAASVFGTPFFAESDLQAQRAVRSSILRDPHGLIGSNLADFDLYSLGEWNANAGTFLCDKQILVSHCKELTDNG